MEGRLTIGRQIAFAISCQEVVALPLALKLRCKLLCRDLGVSYVTSWYLLHWLIILIHIENSILIKRFLDTSIEPSSRRTGNRIIR